MKRLFIILTGLLSSPVFSQDLGVPGRIFFQDTVSFESLYLYVSCDCNTSFWFFSDELVEKSVFKRGEGLEHLQEVAMLRGSIDIIRRTLYDIYGEPPELDHIKDTVYMYNVRRGSGVKFKRIRKCSRRMRISVYEHLPARYIRAIVHRDYLIWTGVDKCFGEVLREGPWYEVFFEIPIESE